MLQQIRNYIRGMENSRLKRSKWEVEQSMGKLVWYVCQGRVFGYHSIFDFYCLNLKVPGAVYIFLIKTLPKFAYTGLIISKNIVTLSITLTRIFNQSKK